MSVVPAQLQVRPAIRLQQVLSCAFVLLAMLLALVAEAQDTLKWTTNYYRVTGLTPRQVRHSMTAARPWRDRNDSDAVTAWTVTWNYTVVPTSQGCRPENVRTVTTITTTLPLFVPPTNAPPELLQRWAQYFTALARHEAQHAAMATGAAEEILAGLNATVERRDCPSLQRELTALAGALDERRRWAEREMDQRTRPGAADGARFP